MTSTAQKPMAELESEFGGKLRLPLPNPFSGDPASWNGTSALIFLCLSFQ